MGAIAFEALCRDVQRLGAQLTTEQEWELSNRLAWLSRLQAGVTDSLPGASREQTWKKCQAT